MRISDWSSDVCSSDLEHHQVGEAPERQRAMDPVRVAGGSDRSDRHPLEVGLHRRGPAGAVVALVGLVVAGATGPGVVGDLVVVDGGDERVEIGRASCRERVCKYVSISVAAGPLKKHKT